jgi:hypothetical protein
MRHLFLVFIFSALCMVMPSLLSAKRLPPELVEPVSTGTLRIEAPLNNGREACIYAYDRADGHLLWSVVVFTQKIDPNLEEDVQWRFITGLKIVGDVIEVTAEGGARYRVFITTRKVEKIVSATPLGRIPLQP